MDGQHINSLIGRNGLLMEKCITLMTKSSLSNGVISMWSNAYAIEAQLRANSYKTHTS